MSSISARWMFLACVATLVACHDDGPGMGIGMDGGGDGAMNLPPDMTFAPAVHAILPQVANQGGPVLAHVKLVTVTFPGFTLDDDVKALGGWIVTSSWYTSVGAEYGVGAGTHIHAQLTTPAPASFNAQGIDDFLAARIADQSLPSATGDDSYLYLLYTPPGTVITDEQDFSCEKYFGTYTPAYHSESMSAGHFAYGLIPTCTMITKKVLQLSSAHEIIEAATDPFVATRPAYEFQGGDPWQETGGEVADICNSGIDVEGFTVTRVWSNMAAAISDNPCVPTTQPYYSMLPSPLQATVPAGGSAMFTVTGWSSAPQPDWMVYILPGIFGGFTITTQIDVATLGNGSIGHVTLTAPANATPGDTSTVLLYSSANMSSEFSWPLTLTIQ